MSGLRNQILTGDALSVLRTLPDGLADCVVTSPPFYGLRDYGVAGQLGQEPDVEAYVAALRSVAAELHRVLKPTGSLWLNLADAFATCQGDGAPRKSLVMAPERLARSLIGEGWLLRNKVVWAKTNPLPSPRRDRLNTTHEFVYFFVKQPRYFFDLGAIRQPARSIPRPNATRRRAGGLGRLAGRRDGLNVLAREGRSAHPFGKNPGDVWAIGTASSRHGHIAPFPAELARRPILASCPEAICTHCDEPWRRPARPLPGPDPRPLLPCGCGAPTRAGLVLDPFIGSGTVARIARELGRDFLGIELKPAYVELARRRLQAEPRAA